jgi:hypothetical protein
MADEKRNIDEPHEELPLSKAAQYLLEECRMVLPGIQALFGFQLVVVFSPGFEQKLNGTEQLLHFFAMVLVALAVAIIMTPAALHRGTGSKLVTETFIGTSARLLLSSMLPLAVAISIEFYLIARVIIGSKWVWLLALLLFGIFSFLWFLLPRVHALQRAITRRNGI